MAGWISSKLKVAETFLQQIDQQAAESLGKNDNSRSESFSGEFSTKLETLPLKDQLKKKIPQTNDVYPSLSTGSDPDWHPRRKKREAVTKSSSIHSPILTDGDWTELLSSSKPISTAEYPNGISIIRTPNDTKKSSYAVSNSGGYASGIVPKNAQIDSTPSEAKRPHKSSFHVPKSVRRLDIDKVNGDVSVPSKQSDESRHLPEELTVVGESGSSGGSAASNFAQRKPSSLSPYDRDLLGERESLRVDTFSDSKEYNKGGSAMLETAATVNSGAGKELHSEINGKRISLGEGTLQEPGPALQVASELVTGGDFTNMRRQVDHDKCRNTPQRDELNLPIGSSLLAVPRSSRESIGTAARKLGRSRVGSSESEGSSGSGTDSASGSDSEDDNSRREERRKRKEQMIAEEAAAKAAGAIKELENMVARLEGEKESLDKILVEREKQQALEALELQMNMMETMEAVDIEKQKHNSTRMEALARLAALETTNAKLARYLATTQRNLEDQVLRVAGTRQEIELKEVAQEDLRRRISNINKSLSSLSQVDHSKGVQFEQEILEAEHSYLCDKIGQLQAKKMKLEENIEMMKKALEDPTEIEIELKKRLSQLTDHLIQKQSQVEALSAEKATLLFRIETVSRSLDEHGLPLQPADSASCSDTNWVSSSGKDDIEAGLWGPSSSRSKHLFQERIRFGGARIGSIVWQLDAVFSAGAVLLRRNRRAQLWLLVYLVCLHFWVMYILLSHSRDSDSNRSGAVVSLETINKTLGA